MKYRQPGFVFILLTASIVAAAQGSVRFDLPAQSLETSLRSVGKNTDLNILIDRKLVRGLQAPALNAQLSPDEAISRLLKGTGLTYQFVNHNTVVLALAKAEKYSQPKAPQSTAAQQQNALQLAQAEPEEKSTLAQSGDETKTEETTEVRVTGSRIRRDPAEASISPVTVFTRVDIERTGAMTMADFMGRITQASNAYASREVGSIYFGEPPAPGSGATTVTLRGLGNNTTLVLVNGRRLPKFGQGFGLDDYNLSGIPMSSVERIEVLTNSASAIYGSDAIAGVINIITRKDYSGLDVMVRYGNTFDTDVSEKNVNLLLGHGGKIWNQRNYSFTLNLAANARNGLSALDRPYTAQSDYADSGGAPAQPPDAFGTYGGAGVVRIPFSEFDPDAMPLPQLPSSEAAIPTGQDGRSLTIADFLASDDVPVNAAQDRQRYRMLFTPTSEQAASGSATLDLARNAQLFVEGSYSYARNEFSGAPPVANQIPVPAGNAFNPFDVDVFVNKVFYELGPARIVFENTGTALAAGLRGALLEGRLEDWRYEVSGDYSRYIGENTTPVPVSINFRRLPSLDANGQLVFTHTPASLAIASSNPATAVNVFGDGRSSQPNDPDFMRSLFGVDDYRETSENWTGSMQADGVLMHLPAGPVKLSLGGEYRKESVDFYKLSTIGRGFVSLDEGASRDSMAAFAELNIPLLPQTLELSLAGRLDSESVFGEEITPRVGLMWSPLKGIRLRTSYSNGYKTPNVLQLYAPDITGDAFYFEPFPVDPLTGLALDGPFLIREGGNPALNPERSTSWTAGVILEPALLPRLSLSVDYFDIDYTDRIAGSVSVQDVLEFFPDRVERDPLTRIVTFVDIRAANLSAARTRGFDVKLVHSLPTATHGTFDTQVSYTYNLENSQQNSPTSPVFELVDQSFFPRVRANATTFWTHRGVELGSTFTYESSTANSFFFETYLPLRIRRAVVMDIQGSLNFDRYGKGAAGEWLQGVKLTVGIDNLLDRKPSATDGDGGYAKVDPRQRRYYMSLRKSF